jgi:hypothetical protein
MSPYMILTRGWPEVEVDRIIGEKGAVLLDDADGLQQRLLRERVCR